MPHALIAGMTESGKTTLACRMAEAYRRKGIPVVVLDPLMDRRWRANKITDNSDEFLSIVTKSRKCAIFVDESGETIGHYQKEMFWLATRARHYGHNSHFISQRPNQLSPTVRDQCSYLFLFAVSRKDAKILSEEFNKPILETACELPRGEYFLVTRFGEPQRIKVDFNGGISTNRSFNRGDMGGRTGSVGEADESETGINGD